MAEKLKVCIAGYGAEGKVNYQYWSDLGHEVAIADERNEVEGLPEGAHTILGEDAFSRLHDYDLVVRTASLNPAKIFTHGKIWSATNEFFEKCPAPIIGVTGTKGKGTTCSLIAKILEEASKTVHLVGNIGVPALQELSKIDKDDLVVFELSSFQLWDLEKSPQTAVVLMIESDHMDLHASMEEYVHAKANITMHQTPDDLLVYHPSNKYTGEIATSSKARKIKYLSDEGANVKNSQIIIDGKKICKTDEVGLLGEHNLQNICAAITAAWKYTQDIEAIHTAVTKFKGLPHRLELVREHNGASYYDDSYSANPAAAQAALNAFSEQHVILILGGYDRGQNYAKLAAQMTNQKNIERVMLIGQTAQKIADELLAAGFDGAKLIHAQSLKEAVYTASEQATNNTVVLLSPGSPSFDMFKNFEERGKAFRKLVEAL